ncbi:MAG: hypothetical protein AAB791_03250 [Patescibacteria group bacterium]
MTKNELVSLLFTRLADHGFVATRKEIGSRACFKGKYGSKRLFRVWEIARKKGCVKEAVKRLESLGVVFQKPGDPSKPKAKPIKRQKKKAWLTVEEKTCGACNFIIPWPEGNSPSRCPNCDELWD